MEYDFTNVIEKIYQFTDILTEETKFLEERQFSKLEKIQDKKNEMAQWVENFILYLENNPDYKNNLTTNEKDALLEANNKYQTILASNQTALLGAMLLNQRLLKLLYNKVQEKQISNILYNEEGKVGNKSSQDNLSLTIDNLI